MGTATIESPKTKKYAQPLDTEHLHADLKGRSVRGGMVTMAGQGAKFLLNLGSIMALARLLTPADFGLIAMVAPITGFLALFQDLGLSMATIQRKEITHEQVSGLFWINVTASLVLTVLCLALAPAVVWFYGDQRLHGVTIAMGSLFIFSGLASQHIAILRRQMRFSQLALVEIVSFAVGVTAAVTAAALGMCYWSLVFLPAGQGITNMLGAWLYSGWFPGVFHRDVGLRSLVAFGGGLTGFNFMNFFARNLDRVLIGSVWGSYSLGLYSRAYSFLVLPIQQINGPINGVATPALSRLQGDPERFRSYFCKALQVSTFFTFPIIGFLILSSRNIILLAFGPQWEPMIHIFQILAFSAFAQVIANMTGILYAALGLGKRIFKWGVMGSSWLCLSFFIGLPYGARGVALAYSIAMLLMLIPAILYAIHPTPVKFRDVVCAIRTNFLFSCIAGLAAYVVRSALHDSSAWLTCLTVAVTFFSTYMLLHAMHIGSVNEIRTLLMNYKHTILPKSA
jgi:O-antigen/teichoic acid export membrane protein